MNAYTSYVLSASATVLGISNTISGISQIAEEGNFQSGAQRCLAGVINMNIGSWLLDVKETTHAGLMQGSLIAGVGTVALSGAEKAFQGIKKLDLSVVVRGTVQAALGGVLAACVASVDSKIMSIAHQASVLCFASSQMICLGAKDVRNGSYTKGLFELAAGVSGVAVIGYYVCCAVSELIKANALPEQLDLFLSQHNDEINRMYRTGEP